MRLPGRAAWSIHLRCHRLLAEAGVKTTNFSGIESNPEAVTINRATAELSAAGCDFVVAVGGGSAMNAGKGIAALAARPCAEDVWPYTLGGTKADCFIAALLFACVPTTAATASKVTPYSVISRRASRGKSVFGHEFLKPRVSWLNPRLTTTLPATVAADGAAGILSHVFENYLLGDAASSLADRHSEAVILTVIETLPKQLAALGDEKLRADLLWASTLDLGGFQSAGRSDSGFTMHSIEHAMSGVRPDLAHGLRLATICPAYFRFLLAKGRATERFAQLGERLFGLSGAAATRAAGFVEHFERWLAANGLHQSAAALDFTPADFEVIADYTVETYGDGPAINALDPITCDEIVRRHHPLRERAGVALQPALNPVHPPAHDPIQSAPMPEPNRKAQSGALRSPG